MTEKKGQTMEAYKHKHFTEWTDADFEAFFDSTVADVADVPCAVILAAAAAARTRGVRS